MTEARDAQRAAVYAAENQVARLLDRSAEFPVAEVAGSHVTLPVERHFADLPSVQAYLDKVLALAWVRQRWPDTAAQPVVVRERRGAARAHYERDGAVVALPLHHGGTAWALRELVVLHELAHHLGGDADTGHGPAFAGRLVELADGVIGPEAAFLLRVTMADQGVTIG
ncbi:MAG TPA: TIGR04338 family metallohydrolase [Nakamurella sp.]|jgi:putative metallohydrolase (TIGR04338 family)|nr:TIGR04338 family metallohydrolase [Nakamurella sp.]